MQPVPRPAFAPKSKVAGPINSPDLMTQRALLCRPVSMKSSSSVDYSSWRNASTDSFWIELLGFGRCTVAAEYFRRWRPGSYYGSWLLNCGCALRLQSLQQVFDDTKHSERTLLLSGS